jgi:hypothetical protein
MPIDYSKYPKNWKTEIRPAILERAKNRCEKCGIKNHDIVIRGCWNDKPVYQKMDGQIFDAENSEYLGSNYVGEVDIHNKNKIIRIVLTISHTDHDINNNKYSNLKALCQRCHINHDKEHHAKNARETREKKKGIIKLEL